MIAFAGSWSVSPIAGPRFSIDEAHDPQEIMPSDRRRIIKRSIKRGPVEKLEARQHTIFEHGSDERSVHFIDLSDEAVGGALRASFERRLGQEPRERAARCGAIAALFKPSP